MASCLLPTKKSHHRAKPDNLKFTPTLSLFAITHSVASRQLLPTSTALRNVMKWNIYMWKSDALYDEASDNRQQATRQGFEADVQISETKLK